MRSVDHHLGHFLNWYTRDNKTTKTVVSPSVTCLIDHTIMLPLHALVSGTLATLAEVYDRMTRRLNEINLNLVVRVLDDLDCHEVFP
jgi:hypothetical protein